MKKKYFPISLYVIVFTMLAILPAGITTNLSVKNAEKIQRQADAETDKRARASLLKEMLYLSNEITRMATNLASWDETRMLFADDTYYNYWKETRINYITQDKGRVDAVDLYDKKGVALTADYTLSKIIYPGATGKPAFVKKNDHAYIVYFRPVTQGTSSQYPLLGYIGIRVNVDHAITLFKNYGHSLIEHIMWHLPDDKIIGINEAVDTARLALKPLPEIDAFTKIIRNGFTEYFVYAATLVALLIILLIFSIARPLRRLAQYLQAMYSGDVNIIPENFHGVIRIRELEEVRQAINDYKNRFQRATITLEEKNKELTKLTYHDPLTGCFNRRAFESRLEHAVETAIIENREHVLCYIDLDQFKVVNDTCGHVAGDELLKQVATLLQNEIRDTDMLARLGGDEFGVLLEGCSLDKARDMAETMRVNIKTHRFSWHDRPLDIGISLGLVPINADNANFGDVLKNADAACYVAKDSGRNRLQIYQPHDKEMAQRYGEMQWVSQIKQALEENRFELHAQRIKPISDNIDTAHYEVLVRLRESNGELVAPMAFIPAAERYNLMTEIDLWIIKTALAGISRLNNHHTSNFTLSINLSGHTLGSQETLNLIKTIITESKINPRQLCFEITETAAITNLSVAAQFIKNLRSLGCRFSLDDFGSGLSSFGYLSNLEVDYIKIDGEFVKSIENSRLSLSIVNSINQIGHVMGVQTVAEHVETPAIMHLLSTIGIDFIQGFAIHKPQPLTEILDQHINQKQPSNSNQTA
ncbi:MAG: EAL domain-containing protein [Gammaproteobacteria bacterium]|jgi:diguanylate cyclase (GGDEF)-like protein